MEKSVKPQKRDPPLFNSFGSWHRHVPKRNFEPTTQPSRKIMRLSLLVVLGDVDSGDESDSASSHATSQPQPLKLLPNTILRVRHETKL